VRVLLDTNALIRWLKGEPLPKRVERTLANPSTEWAVSIVSAWEIVIKAKLGIQPGDIDLALSQTGAGLLPIKMRHLQELSRLPLQMEHRDPFDRMLIAQALSEGLNMITSDTRFLEYKSLRVLWG
jgi:PIN domain nuclease of toxin-antitoxin system